MHHEETLETVATLSNLADAFQSNVDVFLANGVVTTSVVVGSIFLALDQVLGVEQVLVSSTAEVVDDVGLQIGKDSTRDVPKGTGVSKPKSCGAKSKMIIFNLLSSAGFGEEGGERVILGLGVLGLGAVGGNTVFHAEPRLNIVKIGIKKKPKNYCYPS